ncbi:hypothetical protein CJP74_00990 [Psittacicella melopsittaci]|uniref:Trk system potassium uptake protein n=1 Tax=Psittacicella melopsittaci TaxID=2028576 RepID=A0A3A1YC13_9GAMM|nr:potassium transporter TrkG [Psittacicella melopsittaci]RIY33754.1 hypothetical protein CJP74_00990 [Psittacicella melopsittaci]
MFNVKFIRYTLGNLTYMITFLMFLTLLVSLYYQDGQATVYLRYIIILTIGGILLKFNIKVSEVTRLRSTDLFLTTTLIWLYCVLVCMLPYMIITDFSFADSFFEMSSGVTTTGSTIITDFESIPVSLLFWRSITQWLGGVGFIVVGVLILPNLGTGGMKLFKTESSDSEEKSFAHYRDLALAICVYYLFLTFACILAYWLCGMSKLNAVLYSFTTVSTGGFTPTAEPFSGLTTIYWPGIIFMWLSALPFQVFVLNIRGRSPMRILKDQQIVVYTLLLAFVAFLITLDRYLAWTGTEGGEQYQHSIFFLYWESLANLVNVSSNTGFTITNISVWGATAVGLIGAMAMLGGCSGSTSGGLKVFRLNIIHLFVQQQLRQTIHANAHSIIVYNGQVVSNDDFKGVMFFICLYFITACWAILFLAFTGLTIEQAISSVVTNISNTGVTITGPVSSSTGGFDGQTDLQKIINGFVMLLGRLECSTMLVLLLPRFWRY